MKELIAQAIFDWLTTTGEGPFTYNSDLTPLETGVDGHMDCLKLAAFITARIEESAK